MSVKVRRRAELLHGQLLTCRAQRMASRVMLSVLLCALLLLDGACAVAPKASPPPKPIDPPLDAPLLCSVFLARALQSTPRGTIDYVFAASAGD